MKEKQKVINKIVVVIFFGIIVLPCINASMASALTLGKGTIKVTGTGDPADPEVSFEVKSSKDVSIGHRGDHVPIVVEYDIEGPYERDAAVVTLYDNGNDVAKQWAEDQRITGQFTYDCEPDYFGLLEYPKDEDQHFFLVTTYYAWWTWEGPFNLIPVPHEESETHAFKVTFWRTCYGNFYLTPRGGIVWAAYGTTMSMVHNTDFDNSRFWVNCGPGPDDNSPEGVVNCWLNWTVVRTPDFGTEWEITPDHGDENDPYYPALAEGESKEIEVWFKLPKVDEKTVFSGEILFQNTDVPTNFDTVTITAEVEPDDDSISNTNNVKFTPIIANLLKHCPTLSRILRGLVRII